MFRITGENIVGYITGGRGLKKIENHRSRRHGASRNVLDGVLDSWSYSKFAAHVFPIIDPVPVRRGIVLNRKRFDRTPVHG